MKFKAMKFRVNNPEHSEVVQRVLFDLGYSWGGRMEQVMNTHSNYLFTHDGSGSASFQDGQIGYSVNEVYFQAVNCPEIDVSWLDPADNETIEIEGRTYRKSDVVDRLAELDPVE